MTHKPIRYLSSSLLMSSNEENAFCWSRDNSEDDMAGPGSRLGDEDTASGASGGGGGGEEASVSSSAGE